MATAQCNAIASVTTGEQINAGGGNDVVNAGGGNDLVYGGWGNDTVDGGAGDIIYGGSGNDTGGAGDDVFRVLGNKASRLRATTPTPAVTATTPNRSVGGRGGYRHGAVLGCRRHRTIDATGATGPVRVL